MFHLERVHLVPEAAPDSPIEVRLWEGEGAHGYLDDELYLRLERQAAIDGGPMDLRTTLLRPSGRRDVPAGILVARLLATDGARTDSLMCGDVAEANDVAQISNVTRVTRARPARLDGRLPWRVNAYARMPVARFAQCGPLTAYLDVHDVTRGRSPAGPGASTADAGILGVSRQPAKRVLGSEVHLGESVALTLEPTAFGGDGATWLVGELLARALTERTDLLRFSHACLVDPEGRIRADYGNRGGERLPPPFG